MTELFKGGENRPSGDARLEVAEICSDQRHRQAQRVGLQGFRKSSAEAFPLSAEASLPSQVPR